MSGSIDQHTPLAQASEESSVSEQAPSAPPTPPVSPAPPANESGPFKGLDSTWVFGIVGLALIGALVIGLFTGALGGRGAASNSSTSLSVSTGPKTGIDTPHKPYDASAPAALDGDTVDITLDVNEGRIGIAPNVTYEAWMYGGSVPGPVLRVKQGQTVNFTLVNKGKIAHSLDFHAAQTPPNVNYVNVLPGKSLNYTWKANFPGVFMYHCGTPTVAHHMANGMYGAIIVDPSSGWSPAREYVLVQSEFYMKSNGDGTFGLDVNGIMAGNPPDLVVFNGYANQYKDAPLTAKPNEKVRLFVLNAGPSDFSAFHVIGAIMSDVYADGNPANKTVGQQTVTIPPGGGAVLEFSVPEAGSYPFVTHSFSDAMKGAIGVLKVE
ncbi:MAG TPA: multicopper oxidase domain-containing protein [Ktedonobacterales bacterium]|jgi:nitrite reductase (NO-forming)